MVDRSRSGAPAPRTGVAAQQRVASALAEELDALRTEMRRRHVESGGLFEGVHPAHRQSAANLVDYLTLRGHDIRGLQESLAEMGLSSLGRAQEHVITTVERVLDTLDLLAGDGGRHRTEAAVSFGGGRETLEANALALLGPPRPGRDTRILVTMPSEAADDFELVHLLILRGMDCARVNLAHDGPDAWARMVSHLRDAALKAGRACPILMDLPGPKLRTGPVEPGPRVVRLRPRRDACGRPTIPASAVLVADGDPDVPLVPGDPRPRIPVSGPWLRALDEGDTIGLRDTRNSRRTLVVTARGPGWAAVAVADTTYLASGTRLSAPSGEADVGVLAPVEQALLVCVGDVLTLTADTTPVRPPGSGLAEPVCGHQRIGCTLPAALEALEPGHRVFLDDGKIGGVVLALRPGEADVQITASAPGGTKLRAEKGINLPDSHVALPALTAEDDELVGFVARHADLVGLSFAQSPADVAALRGRLERVGGQGLGIVLKVETARGFAALPEMLLSALGAERVGVMVARGDLAVECGFERLAEVQEEMLLLCDAAHVPVIWATEVLDQMARTGRPSRAEISDAAMGGRAECVMLNKGPYIAEAVSSLDDILCRMGSHQRKNVPLLRRLHRWTPG
jgi:pyruvate kinase